MRKFFGMAILLMLGMFASTAQAGTIIFHEDFNAENGGVGVLNYTGFANWSISGGTVDLIGNGFFEFPPVTNGHGLYVDLDGSTGAAGLMQHPMYLSHDWYVLDFELAGNQRNAGDEIVDVSAVWFGNQSTTLSIVVPDTQPFVTYSMYFYASPDGPASVSFHNRGGDNIGALLDNVTLTRVPEPGSMALLGSGLLGLAGVIRRKLHR